MCIVSTNAIQGRLSEIIFNTNLLHKIFTIYGTSCHVHVCVHVGEVLGNLCMECGPETFRELEPILLSGIKDNLERDQDLVTDHPQLVEKLSGRQSPDATELERV